MYLHNSQVHRTLAQVKAAIRSPFTSVGSYPVVIVFRDGAVADPRSITLDDFETIARAMIRGMDRDWHVIGVEALYEHSHCAPVECCITGEPIESAYGPVSCGSVDCDVCFEAEPVKVTLSSDPASRDILPYNQGWQAHFTVTADPRVADHDQSIHGSRWEDADGMAYATLTIGGRGEHTDDAEADTWHRLIRQLESEGYEVVTD